MEMDAKYCELCDVIGIGMPFILQTKKSDLFKNQYCSDFKSFLLLLQHF